jgi:hypothetical protein
MFALYHSSWWRAYLCLYESKFLQRRFFWAILATHATSYQTHGLASRASGWRYSRSVSAGTPQRLAPEAISSVLVDHWPGNTSRLLINRNDVPCIVNNLFKLQFLLHLLRQSQLNPCRFDQIRKPIIEWLLIRVEIPRLQLLDVFNFMEADHAFTSISCKSHKQFAPWAWLCILDCLKLRFVKLY